VTVPKATIDKNGYSFCGKNEVGPAKKLRAPTPSLDAIRYEQTHQAKLRRFVPCGLNPAHDLGAREQLATSCSLCGEGFTGHLDLLRSNFSQSLKGANLGACVPRRHSWSAR